MTAKPDTTPTPAPAPTPTLDFAIENDYVARRTSGPNPFLTPVEDLKAGKFKALSIPVPSDNPKDKTVAKYNRQLNEAGKAHGVTVRRGVVPSGDGFKLSFKVTDRIVRKPKVTSAVSK